MYKSNKSFYIELSTQVYKPKHIIKFDLTNNKFIVKKVYKDRWWKRAITKFIRFVYSEDIKFRVNQIKVKML